MINLSYENKIRSMKFVNGEKSEFPLFNIGKYSYINSMKIDSGAGNEIINIQIGNYCSIAYNVLLLINRNHDYKSISTNPLFLVKGKSKIKQKGQVIIGNDVWIGNNTTVLSGVTIGNGAVVGAGTVVVKDVPPYAIVAGNPMRILKYRFSEDEIKKLQKIKWWNWDNQSIEENKKYFQSDIEQFAHKFFDNNQVLEEKNIWN